jgi:hypothetical protein
MCLNWFVGNPAAVKRHRATPVHIYIHGLRTFLSGCGIVLQLFSCMLPEIATNNRTFFAVRDLIAWIYFMVRFIDIPDEIRCSAEFYTIADVS